MRSGFPPTASYKRGSAICWRGRPDGRRTKCAGHMRASITGSWTKPRRVVAKVEWHPGELYPCVGLIVTNMARAAENVVAFYNPRQRCRLGANSSSVRLLVQISGGAAKISRARRSHGPWS